MSKTKQAIELVDAGKTPYEAAKTVGITPTTVYVALKRRESNAAKGLVPCPCCGTVVPDKQIDWSVVK